MFCKKSYFLTLTTSTPASRRTDCQRALSQANGEDSNWCYCDEELDFGLGLGCFRDTVKSLCSLEGECLLEKESAPPLDTLLQPEEFQALFFNWIPTKAPHIWAICSRIICSSSRIFELLQRGVHETLVEWNLSRMLIAVLELEGIHNNSSDYFFSCPWRAQLSKDELLGDSLCFYR